MQFLSLAAEIASLSRQPRTVPAWLLTSTATFLGALSAITARRPLVSPDEARTALHSFIFDNRKARRDLGVEFMPLRDGLERTISWLRDRELI